MNSFYSENFLLACDKGDTEEIKKLLAQGVDINHVDSEGNGGINHAASNNQVNCLRFLEANGAAFEIVNKAGNTPLHVACEKGFKEVILNLLLAGVDPLQGNNEGKKAGEGNIEAKMMINAIYAENKAFKVLSPLQKRKLTQIFEDIDIDGKREIDLAKSVLFNKYVDDNVNDNMAEKDAKEFIKWCAILNKATVNLDEWLFSFSKLLVSDPVAYDKFIDDFEKALSAKGRLKDWHPE